MNREIKFRGKRLDNGEWIYGSLLSIEDTYFIIEQIDFDFDYRTEASAFWCDCTEKEVDPSTIGQYTGLKDRNGMEIYYGDIVRDEYEGVAKVCFDSYSWQLVYRIGDDGDQVQYFDEIEDLRMSIIGNIHDNPELVE